MTTTQKHERARPLHLMRPVRCAALIPVAFAFVVTSARPAGAQSPQAAAAGLLAADRAFSASGAERELIDALDAMFADDVIMPAPQGRLARGRADVIAALKANPANIGVRAEWAPIRAGVSADGVHGFTFGYMTLRRPDASAVVAKYLAYWVKGATGWHVAAYKRAPRAEGGVAADTPREPMAPSLPDLLVPADAATATVAAHRASLIAAEQSFSDLANRIGLGNAFRVTGLPDAVNLGGGGADFVYGNEAIATAVSQGGAMDAKPFSWSAETALVASSGDLGVTFGFIRQNGAPADAVPFPFFTVWRRSGSSAPWKYIAE